MVGDSGADPALTANAAGPVSRPSPSGVDPGYAALAERCEQATGPDRELDVLIGAAIDLQAYEGFGIRDTLRLGSLERAVVMAETHQNVWSTALPRYSASLDAAMTLVPEGWAKYVADDEHGCHACVWDRGSPQKRGGSGGCKEATTPALALCAAALRARAAIDEGSAII